MSNPIPPSYILVLQSEVPIHPSTRPPTSTLVHPLIQYHFANDPPQALLPTSPNESVLIIDYDPSTSASPQNSPQPGPSSSPQQYAPNPFQLQPLQIQHDTNGTSEPIARSLSSNIAVAGLKVTKAPGAQVQAQVQSSPIIVGLGGKKDGVGCEVNDNMYIVETVQTIGELANETGAGDSAANLNGQAMLMQFRQMNALLRRAIDFPVTASKEDTNGRTDAA